MVGQNIFISMGPESGGSNWDFAIKNWFDEYKTYIYGTTTYNHYTQVYPATILNYCI